MYSKLVGLIAIGVVAVGVVTTASAQQSSPAAPRVDVGKYEYDGHCAICHGLSGTAQEEGAFFSLLTKKIPNLTTLSKNNNGVFPFARVYQTIDGREQVQAHGTREMPVWGREYTGMATSISPYYDSEAFARAKILALTEYVYRRNCPVLC